MVESRYYRDICKEFFTKNVEERVKDQAKEGTPGNPSKLWIDLKMPIPPKKK
jgi:hypothetical protein